MAPATSSSPLGTARGPLELIGGEGIGTLGSIGGEGTGTGGRIADSTWVGAETDGAGGELTIGTARASAVRSP